MIVILYFYLIFVKISIIYATNICINSSPCKCILSAGHAIDISSVGRTDHPRFYEINSNNENDTKLYSYNPCYGFDSPDHFAKSSSGNTPCKGAAACVRTPGGKDGQPPEEHAIGIQSTGIFGTVPQYGYHINYTVPNSQQRLMVILNCTNKTDSLTVETPEMNENKNIVMRLYTKCACPDGCGSSNPISEQDGLSTGSKLLITFFTILLAYFILGIVWNFFNGAKGLELMPNYDFWNDLPKLIVEGLAFTCSCFSKKSSYGEV